MTIQEQDTLISELIELAIELGANKWYINKLIITNGITLEEAVYRGYINEDK